MNWLVSHIASGQAFFTGVALLVVAAIASLYPHAVTRRIVAIGFLLGAVLVVVSSTPLPWWAQAVAGGATLVWLGAYFVPRLRRGASWGMIAVWVAMAGMEAPYHVTPQLAPTNARSLTIVGDSLAAGAGDSDRTEKWPAILARVNRLELHDLSRMGDTTSKALKRIQAEPATGRVVIIEIGGNDLLGGTPVERFERGLDALLGQVCSDERQVVMLELPLPPLCHGYGRAQRRLAHRHGVKLIPKRHLMSVLAESGATTDSIHLSEQGHRQLAERLRTSLEPAFP